jgi:tetratricopeptide (TPR) repeat protein
MSAEFLAYDDQDYVYQNPHVAAGLATRSVAWAWTHTHSGNWHPLAWISHMADVELFGLDPAGHHAMGLTLHALNAVLLYLALASLTGERLPSFFVAAIFAVHPVNVEAAGWVSQRKTLLSTLLAVAAVWSYGAGVRRRSRALYAASLAAYAGSLMAKQTFVTLPFLLFLVDYWPLRRKEFEPPGGGPPTIRSVLAGCARVWKQKAPYAVLAVAAGLTTLSAQTIALQSLDVLPLGTRLGNVVLAYARHAGAVFWPDRLAIFYPLRPELITAERVLTALALLGGATVGALWLGRRLRYVAVGWLWFLISLAPMIGVVQVGHQAYADRYLYSSCWGLIVAAVWLVWEGARWGLEARWSRPAAAAVLAAPLALFAPASHQRAERWRTTVGVFEEAAANAAPNAFAHQALAMRAIDRGDLEDAIEHCEESLRAAPDALTLVLASAAHRGLNQTDLAREKLEAALRLDPELAAAHSQLARLQADAGEFDAALRSAAVAGEKVSTPLNQLSSRRPAGVYRDWGYVLERANRVEESLEKYEKALEYEPANTALLQDAAQAELKLNRVDRAAARLAAAAQIDPGDARTQVLLGAALARQGSLADAAEAFRKGIEADPKDHQARVQFAKTLARLGRFDEADRRLQEALAGAERGDSPDPRISAELHFQLGDVALAKGDPAAAAREYETALELRPDHFAANNNLAWLLATHPDPARRDSARAVALAERASELRQGRDYSSLGTLAAAYAADGRMEQAVATARGALRLAREAGDAAAARQIEAQLRLHEQGRPYVEPAQGAERGAR